MVIILSWQLVHMMRSIWTCTVIQCTDRGGCNKHRSRFQDQTGTPAASWKVLIYVHSKLSVAQAASSVPSTVPMQLRYVC